MNLIFHTCVLLVALQVHAELSLEVGPNPLDETQDEESLLRLARFKGIPLVFRNVSHIVSVRYHGLMVCAGAVIHPRIIVTAASCVDGRTYEGLTVVVHKAILEKMIVYQVTGMSYHEDYNSLTAQADLALLRIEHFIPFTGAIKRAKLPDRDTLNSLEIGTTGILTGWSRISLNDASDTKYLMIENVQVARRNDCSPSIHTEDHICLHSLNNITCAMDKGAIFLVGGQLEGILSFGCDEQHENVSSTSIRRYTHWIEQEKHDLLSNPYRPAMILHPTPPEVLKSNREKQKNPISIEQAKFMVSILSAQYYHILCSGVIIAPSYILTSFHCVLKSIHHYKIRSGSSFWNGGGELHDVVKVFKDEESMNFGVRLNNLAVVQVSPRFVYSGTTGEIPRLNSFLASRILPSDTLTVYGWGNTENYQDKPEFGLQMLNVSLTVGEDCRREFSDGNSFHQDLIRTESRIGNCVSDYGGPLVIDDHLIGIHYRSPSNCGNHWFPVSYTNVTVYEKQIFKIVVTSLDEFR